VEGARRRLSVFDLGVGAVGDTLVVALHDDMPRWSEAGGARSRKPSRSPAHGL
jgi:hypothetical protein